MIHIRIAIPYGMMSIPQQSRVTLLCTSGVSVLRTDLAFWPSLEREIHAAEFGLPSLDGAGGVREGSNAFVHIMCGENYHLQSMKHQPSITVIAVAISRTTLTY